MTMSDMDLQIQKLEQEVDLGRKRLTADRMDISFGELLNMYRDGELIIRPEYQRLYRWNNAQKTALIESLLLSIPIPPIFVAENEDGVWEIIDGLQRVSTFLSFFGELKANFSVVINNVDNDEIDDEKTQDDNIDKKNGNKWVLESGSIIKTLEGFNVDTLPTSFKINLKRSVCRIEILRGKHKNDMKYELFKRLNSGGSRLTPQEIRNAIYRGVDVTLNNLLLELSQNPIFIKMTALSVKKREELYDQELVLTFFAFLNYVDFSDPHKNGYLNLNKEEYLNKFMEKTVQDRNYNYQLVTDLFLETLQLIDNLSNDSEKVFKNSNNLFVPSYFEGIMIGVANNISKYRNNRQLLMQKIEDLKGDEIYKKYSAITSSSRSRIKNKLERINEIFS